MPPEQGAHAIPAANSKRCTSLGVTVVAKSDGETNTDLAQKKRRRGCTLTRLSSDSQAAQTRARGSDQSYDTHDDAHIVRKHSIGRQRRRPRDRADVCAPASHQIHFRALFPSAVALEGVGSDHRRQVNRRPAMALRGTPGRSMFHAQGSM